ncbi:MAG: BTAD domain-containing putative transcriptional regulator [Pseudonocardia sp.]
MEFRILGPVGVSDPGGDVAVGGPRHRVLLAALLMDAGSVVSADRLIEALWGEEPPPRATEMLHVRISELRKSLRREAADPDLIVTRRPGYLLDVAPEQVDARRFERSAVAARAALLAGDPAAAAAQLRTALAMWHGPALADIAGRPFAEPEIARLEHMRVQAVEDRITADLAMGRHREVVAELESLVRAQPLHEQYRYQLMVALYRSARQSEALAVFRDAEDRLREELGVDPAARLQELRDAILRQDRSLDAEPDRPEIRLRAHNVPVQITSFVGRKDELAEIGALLADHRLVTLTGVGGAGKSRLATEIARSQIPTRPDGVWVVDLAAVLEPRLIVPALASVLGMHDHPHHPLRDLVVERLRDSSALLVIDNCDHLLDGVAELVRPLLLTAPNLRVLCTSRERLDIIGEVVRHVGGLSVPGPDAAGADNAEAVELFVDRASAVRAGRPFTDDEVAAIGEITRRLDGLPLSIELAAARTATFSTRQIVDRLGDRFRLLSRGGRGALPRHQTLRAVIDWSYALLTEPEQCVFDRLAVFVGGFTLEAVEAVCLDAASATAQDPTDLLARLVDKSLVVVDAAESPEYRYRILETLREYGLDKLAGGPRGVPGTGPAAARERHARYFAELGTRAEAQIGTSEEISWLGRVGFDEGNLRAALAHSLASTAGSHEEVLSLPIAAALGWFLYMRGRLGEGMAMLERVLGEVDAGPAAPPEGALAGALLISGSLATALGQLDRAEALLLRALRVNDQAGCARRVAIGSAFLGHVARARGSHDHAGTRYRHAAAIHEQLNSTAGIAWSRYDLGLLARDRGRLDEAAEQLGESLTRFRDTGYTWGTACAAWALATVELRQRRLDRAATLLVEALDCATAAGDGRGVAQCLEAVAGLLCAQRDFPSAARLLGAAGGLREVLVAPLPDEERGEYTAVAQRVWEALGPEAAQRALGEGSALSQAAALTAARRALAGSAGMVGRIDPLRRRGESGPIRPG